MNAAAPGARLAQGAPDEAEAALWREKQAGSAEAREKLFELHLPFARGIAGRQFRDRGRGDLEFADLLQLACTGLLEAIDGYDPGRGVPFRGYAARRVRGSVADGIARTSELREQLSFRRRVRRDRMASLAAEGGAAQSSADALAALADLAVGLAVGFMLEGTGLVAGKEASDPRPGPYEGEVFRRVVRRMHEEILALPERERLILRYHYEEGLLFEHIADLLGVTKGRVSQLHRGALGVLRKRLRQAGHFRVEG